MTIEEQLQSLIGKLNWQLVILDNKLSEVTKERDSLKLDSTMKDVLNEGKLSE